MSAFEVTRVTLRLGKREVLRELTLSHEGERGLGLLGPSGAGKTSLLRCIAGLERVAAGSISLSSGDAMRLVDGDGSFVPPQERGVQLVFQDLALWPHLNAREHIALVMGTRAREAVVSHLSHFQIDHIANQRPDQISGGEQRRLALARALVRSPRLLLLDEPFVGLDPPLIDEMKDLLRTLRAEDCFHHLVLVSHRWSDMEGLVDRVAMLDRGRLLAEGTPEEVKSAVAGTRLEAFFG